MIHHILLIILSNLLQGTRGFRGKSNPSRDTLPAPGKQSKGAAAFRRMNKKPGEHPIRKASPAEMQNGAPLPVSIFSPSEDGGFLCPAETARLSYSLEVFVMEPRFHCLCPFFIADDKANLIIGGKTGDQRTNLSPRYSPVSMQ